MEQQHVRNILIICADMIGAQHVGCYGNPVGASPNVDKLAQRGIRFENAYCAATPCIPARASMLTGLYAHTHGKTVHMKMPLNPCPPLLTELLADAGYNVGWVGKTHWWPSNDDLGCHDIHLTIDSHLTRELGEDDAYMRHLVERGLVDLSQPWPVVKAQISPDALPEDALKVHWTGRTTEDMLRRYAVADEPFFITCSFVEPHGPGSVKPELLDEFIQRPIPAINAGDPNATDLKQQVRAALWAENIGGDKKHEYRAGVYASLKLVDQNIGKLMATLDELDLWKNTTVFFTSDHGDLMFDHGLREKTFLYEAAVHVPLIVAGAGVPQGETRSQLVSHLDLMPTVLDMTNTTPSDLRIEGRSLVPVIDDAETPWREFLFCEAEQSVHLPKELGVHSSVTKMVRQGAWKYIYTLVGGERLDEELYHLGDDPHETRNIAAEHPDVVRRLRTELLHWLVRGELMRLHPAPENHYPVPTVELPFE